MQKISKNMGEGSQVGASISVSKFGSQLEFCFQIYNAKSHRFCWRTIFFSIIKAGASIYLMLLAFCCGNEILKRTYSLWLLALLFGGVVRKHITAGEHQELGQKEKKRKGTSNNLSMVLPPVNRCWFEDQTFHTWALGDISDPQSRHHTCVASFQGFELFLAFINLKNKKKHELIFLK